MPDTLLRFCAQKQQEQIELLNWINYITKVESKGRTIGELHKVIEWLTGFDNKKLQELINEKVTFETFFKGAKLNPDAQLITGEL